MYIYIHIYIYMHIFYTPKRERYRYVCEHKALFHYPARGAPVSKPSYIYLYTYMYKYIYTTYINHTHVCI